MGGEAIPTKASRSGRSADAFQKENFQQINKKANPADPAIIQKLEDKNLCAKIPS